MSEFNELVRGRGPPRTAASIGPELVTGPRAPVALPLRNVTVPNIQVRLPQSTTIIIRAMARYDAHIACMQRSSLKF